MGKSTKRLSDYELPNFRYQWILARVKCTKLKFDRTSDCQILTMSSPGPRNTMFCSRIFKKKCWFSYPSIKYSLLLYSNNLEAIQHSISRIESCFGNMISAPKTGAKRRVLNTGRCLLPTMCYVNLLALWSLQCESAESDAVKYQRFAV